MEIYVLQCLSGNEDQLRKRLVLAHPELAEHVHIPRRHMKIRKQGRHFTKEYILFPGYIFLETEHLEKNYLESIRTIDSALRILPDSLHPLPLNRGERELLSRLLRNGEVLGSSAVQFDTNNRIQVIQGPLEGLEGSIVKVDRRKGRARVRLDMYDRTFEVDFSFHDMKKQNSADVQE
ncbi:antiterminator LoaP [Salinispira pacifica]|uniref:Transcription antitermination protein NusG n=1 Tax=Salinispira pacifica TaxID=1307761 RepID=V5WF94_9SPIO|nr:antiterminator LoaP [Salinispira pacifica]AHC14468.1 Transcription antitermination protein NusG [Salinispira pacifica]